MFRSDCRSAHLLGVLSCVLVSVVANTVLAADRSAERPQITGVNSLPETLHRVIQSRDYDTAIKQIEQALQANDTQSDETASADFLLYLKGRVLTELEKPEEAEQAFLQLEREHPQSRWVSRARFGRAAVAVAKRQYDRAGEIYRAEAERLLSRDRKDELAATYLEFADRYFQGIPSDDPSKKRNPEYQQALEYYRQALTLGPSVAKRQHIEFLIARCLEELDQFNEAITAYQAFLKNYGLDSPQSGQVASPTLRAEATYRLGLCQLENHQSDVARRTWQDFVSDSESLPADVPAADVTAAESDVAGDWVAKATYHLAHTYGMPNPATIGDMELGISMAEQFLASYPEHPLAVKAELEIAQAYQKHGRNVQSVSRLERLIANPTYAGVEQLAEARRMLGQAYLAQNQFEQAITAWKSFLEKHPTDSKWPDVQQQIIGAEYAAAQHAEQQSDYRRARELWQTFLNKYPLDDRAPQILFEFGEMNYRDAAERHRRRVEQSERQDNQRGSLKLDAKTRELFELAIADWQRLVAKYPESEQASRASLRIGITLEDRLERRGEALESYRKVTGDAAGRAQQRIAQLTRPQLLVMTPRKFRSDESAAIRLTTRNLKSVSVAVYSIDMTDYFRKMHLATGVEKLDIALIDPDEQFDYQIPDYADYKQIEQDVEIPIGGVGVKAVTVSSETMEATTMVVVSDLDIVVKSSRNELFLFAQNMLSGKPAAGVGVLVSDGDQVFDELSTNDEGIARSTSDQLQRAKDLRVFAVDEGHVASTVTPLRGLEFAVGLAPTGYLFTDRPVYRPGQLMHIKGIVRWVDGDRFVFEPGERYTLDVYDPRGRLLKSEEVALNRFGTVHTHLLLPESTPEGACRLHLHRPSSSTRPALSFDSQFAIQHYQLEPVQLSVETDSNVYYRGQEITATVRLRYDYGAALADQEITYMVGTDGEQRTARTDDEGNATLTISTTRFSESQSLKLIVSCPSRNVSQTHTVYLATRGFTVQVQTPRTLYIDGETFDTTVMVKDPGGQAVETALTLQVYRMTDNNASRGDGRSGETLVQSVEVKTDGQTGQASQTLKIEGAGRYWVRATGTDQFGQTVSGQTALQISGDEDSTRLRILADKHHHRVGDEAEVNLHWREAPSLALVTYDGASVLGHRLVSLQRGVNSIRIPITPDLAPNFFLSVCVMQRNQFHESTSEFRVEKRLRIKLTPSTATPEPTGKVSVAIEVTDSSGRPTESELTLSLVRKSLLDRYTGVQRPIGEAFSSGIRQRKIRQTSSCTFQYATSTRPIDEAVLVEAERRLRRSAEEVALGELFDRHPSVRGMADDRMEWGLSDFESIDGLSAGDFDGDALGRESLWADISSVRRGDANSQKVNAAFDQPSMIQLPVVEEMMVRGRRGQVTLYRFDKRVKSAPDAMPGYSVPIDTFSMEQLQQRDRTVNGLTADGRMLVVNGIGQQEVDRLAREEGARVLAGVVGGETGFWDPLVVTDPQGKAEIELVMPAESTTWQLSGRAISVQALAGEGAVELITRKSIFGLVKVPQSLTVGDQAQVKVEVHHTDAKNAMVEVVLKTTMGDRSVEQTRGVSLSSDSDVAQVESLSFPTEATDATEATFELTLKRGEQVVDTRLVSIPVKPFGVTTFRSVGGNAAQNTVALIGFDEGEQIRGRSLELMIGGDVNQTLLQSVLGGESILPRWCLPTHPTERSVSDVLGGVALLQLLRDAPAAESPQTTMLTEMISGGVANLIASQDDQGGWSLAAGSRANGDAATVDHLLSARVMWALSVARKAGFAVPSEQFQRGIAMLRLGFSTETDLQRQAVLLAALSHCGEGDFALANRLYRERHRIDSLGLAHLMMVLTLLNHNDMAGELVSIIQSKLPAKTSPAMRGHVEVAAIELLALQQMKSRPELRVELADKLLRARAGTRWPVESENGPAIAALSRHYGDVPAKDESIRLSIFVNGHPLDPFTLSPGQAGRRIRVPEEALVGGRQRIEFELEGRGEFSYSAVMTGFADAEDAKSTTDDWTVSRRLEPDQLRFRGMEIRRGHRVVSGSSTWKPNTLTELPVGQRGLVTLSPRVRYVNSKPQRASLMLVEPIPAGCTVIEETIRGGFDRYEMTPGAITFYIGDQRTPSDIQYALAGDLPGTYRVAPAVLRSYYRPDQVAISGPVTLDVLQYGEESSDEYRLTPDEYFYLGREEFNAGQFQAAFDHLSTLLDQWRLNSEPFSETVQLLFRSSLKLDSHPDIVTYFEIIKEKFPDVELTFEEILDVAAAYREIAEYERSYLVYRATVQASFEKENQVAGFLNSRGEFLRSVQTMESLLRDYPPESYVATASYALAQEVYRRANSAADDKALVSAGVTRVHLINASIRMLDDFLTQFSQDPSSDQASFALATALIDLQQYRAAIERSERYAEVFSESRLLDSFWYMIGFCYFELQDHQRALEMCRKVAESRFEDSRSGTERDADNKWEAIYIMGQIYHSLGKAAEAIQQYSRVSDRFNDAAEAIEYFSHQAIELPDVTTLLPNEDVRVTLRHRNLSEVHLKVYRIDLMKFGLTQRNLDQITAINLAGIKPYHQATTSLGDGKDYRDRETVLPLPLKELGAYLVVARGENLYTSGLVVISPLWLTTEEDPVSGRVRVVVKDKQKDTFVGGVHVKVIGSGNEQFVSGQTDLRGLFVAEDIQGTSTVIAVGQDSQYAFSRGETVLQPKRSRVDEQAEQLQQIQAVPQMQTPASKGAPLLQNLFNTNSVFQIEQKQNIDDLINNGREGVQSKEAY